MSTLRPTVENEENFKAGQVHDDVYNAASDYISSMTIILEQMPESVQRISSELLTSDYNTSTALTKLEELLGLEPINYDEIEHFQSSEKDYKDDDDIKKQKLDFEKISQETNSFDFNVSQSRGYDEDELTTGVGTTLDLDDQRKSQQGTILASMAQNTKEILNHQFTEYNDPKNLTNSETEPNLTEQWLFNKTIDQNLNDSRISEDDQNTTPLQTLIPNLLKQITKESQNSKNLINKMANTLKSFEEDAELMRTNFLREWINGKKFEHVSDDDSDDKKDKIPSLPIKKPEKIETRIESPKFDQIRPSIAEKVKMGEGRRKLVSESEEKKKVEKIENKTAIEDGMNEAKSTNPSIILKNKLEKKNKTKFKDFGKGNSIGPKQSKILLPKTNKKIKRELSLSKIVKPEGPVKQELDEKAIFNRKVTDFSLKHKKLTEKEFIEKKRVKEKIKLSEQKLEIKSGESLLASAKQPLISPKQPPKSDKKNTSDGPQNPLFDAVKSKCSSSNSSSGISSGSTSNVNTVNSFNSIPSSIQKIIDSNGHKCKKRDGIIHKIKHKDRDYKYDKDYKNKIQDIKHQKIRYKNEKCLDKMQVEDCYSRGSSSRENSFSRGSSRDNSNSRESFRESSKEVVKLKDEKCEIKYKKHHKHKDVKIRLNLEGSFKKDEKQARRLKNTENHHHKIHKSEFLNIKHHKERRNSETSPLTDRKRKERPSKDEDEIYNFNNSCSKDNVENSFAAALNSRGTHSSSTNISRKLTNTMDHTKLNIKHKPHNSPKDRWDGKFKDKKFEKIKNENKKIIDFSDKHKEYKTKSDDSIDEDNKKYCYCNKRSYGKMVACDNTFCPTEWFHYNCAGITQGNEPTDKWFCKGCKRKDVK